MNAASDLVRSWVPVVGGLGLLCLTLFAGEVEPRYVFEDCCTGCHSPHSFLGDDRSEKSWQLTVYRMQGYGSFSDADAKVVIKYLAEGNIDRDYGEDTEDRVQEGTDKGLGENLPSVSAEMDEPSRPVHSGQPVETTAEPLLRAGVNYRFPRRWNSGPAYIRAGHASAYLAAFALAALALSGVGRSRLGAMFRPVHRAAAFTMLVVVSGHALVFYFKYGAPPVLWLWYGIFAIMAVLASFVTGFWRHRLHVHYRAVHCGLGAFAAGFVALHWIWAWL